MSSSPSLGEESLRSKTRWDQRRKVLRALKAPTWHWGQGTTPVVPGKVPCSTVGNLLQEVSKTTPTYSLEHTPNLNHLFMKDILSYWCFGVCSRGLLEFSKQVATLSWEFEQDSYSNPSLAALPVEVARGVAGSGLSDSCYFTHLSMSWTKSRLKPLCKQYG